MGIDPVFAQRIVCGCRRRRQFETFTLLKQALAIVGGLSPRSEKWYSTRLWLFRPQRHIATAGHSTRRTERRRIIESEQLVYCAALRAGELEVKDAKILPHVRLGFCAGERHDPDLREIAE
jgi:hypothetical protein